MNDNRVKVALICFDNPFLKPMEGGKRAMLSHIESLIGDDMELDIYLHNKRNEGIVDAEYLSKYKAVINQYVMNSTFSSFCSRFPICVKKRFVKQCMEDLTKKKYDIAIYEGEQVSAYRLMNVVNASKHIIYMHDIESKYRTEIVKANKNIIVKIANTLEALKFRKIEKVINKYFDNIWFISKEECDLFKNEVGDKNKCVYIPFPALEISNQIVVNNSKKLLYVGDLTIAHNFLSLEWYLKNVYSDLRKSIDDIEFRVVGKISDKNKNALITLGATVLGYIDDLEFEYTNAAAVVCPILYGAGVKVKTIDALAKGQIVITTVKGIEGTELVHNKHLIATDDVEELKKLSSDVLCNRNKFLNLASVGLDFIKSRHTVVNQKKIMKECILRIK